MQELSEQDYHQRLAFCQRMLQEIENDENFLRRIIFSDESTFGRDGNFNMHNNHHYAEENPRVVIVNKHQNRFSRNEYCAIVGDRLVKLIIFQFFRIITLLSIYLQLYYYF